jgi:hypothetical protein
VVFAIGAVVFVVTLIAGDSALSFLGLSLVFGGVGANLLGDGLGARPKWKSGIVQDLSRWVALRSAFTFSNIGITLAICPSSCNALV